MSDMEMAMTQIGTLLREHCDSSGGVVCVSPQQVTALIKSRKSEKIIRAPRAERIRGSLAREVEAGTAILMNSDGWKEEWMGPMERETANMRMVMTWETDQRTLQQLGCALEKAEAMAAVLTWAMENEELPHPGKQYVLRKEKRAQLRTARHRLWKSLGEGSLNATIMMLTEQNKAYPEMDPDPDWIWNAAVWVKNRGWTTESEDLLTERVTLQLATLRSQRTSRDGNRAWDTILDLGEGWGSIGTACTQIQCASIGVDWAGPVYQGTLHGTIRARTHMDFAGAGTTNLLRRIAKKAEVAPSSLLMVWLSPECSLLSRANVMNISRGCAHGPYAETPENRASATPQRLQEEREAYKTCLQAVEEQMKALEEEYMWIALENPLGSHFWELKSVTSRMKRNPKWKLTRVDQCTYGRPAQKATMILTNMKWKPKGLTGNGRCKVGMCGGTLGNTPGTPGAAEHAQQTVANVSEKRTRVGDEKRGAKGQYSMKAAKNRVENMLVQELIQAARKQRNRASK